MTRRAYEAAVQQAIAYYAAGVNDGSYEHLMDDLTIACSDAQWEALTQYLARVDDWLAQTDKATIAQRECWLAKQEGRKSRFPLVFFQGTPEADAQIAALSREFGIAIT
jgi:hypothetical protein